MLEADDVMYAVLVPVLKIPNSNEGDVVPTPRLLADATFETVSVEVVAVVIARLVVVAAVPVPFVKVKAWSVLEPLDSILLNVPRPVDVRAPELIAVAHKLVLEAVVEKNTVVVAFVPVPFVKVKAWRVVEPFTNKLPAVAMLPSADVVVA